MAPRLRLTNEQERKRVGELANTVQRVIGESVELAYVDQEFTGKKAAAAALSHGIELVVAEVAEVAEVKRTFVLLLRR